MNFWFYMKESVIYFIILLVMISQDVDKLGTKIQEAKRKLQSYDLSTTTTTNFMLGLTGSGKSALISYLLGADIQSKKEGLTWVMSHNQPDKFPEIGNKYKSCTEMPNIFTDGKECYLDLAGFMDTAGEIQEIINAYVNSKMFRRGNKTRILIVVQERTLTTARAQSLVELAARIQGLFPANFSTIVNCCEMVLTKANISENKFDDYMNTLESISYQNECLTNDTKHLLKTIIQFKRVVLFPQPRFHTPQVINNIRQKIRSVEAYVLEFDASISLSSKAKNLLNDFSQGLIFQVRKMTDRIKGAIESMFDAERFNDKNSMGKAIGKLKSAMRIMNVEYEHGQWESFDMLCKELSLQKGLAEKISGLYEKMKFCKSLQPDLSIRTDLIQKLVSSMRNALVKLQSKLSKETTREEMQKMNQKHQQNLEKRDKEFRAFVSKMQEDARRREERARQEMAEYRQHMAQQMRQQSRQFQVFVEQMKEEAQARERRAREDLQNQQKYFEGLLETQQRQHSEAMSRMESNHSEQMRGMNQQIESLKKSANKKPQVIVKKRGMCEIM